MTEIILHFPPVRSMDCAMNTAPFILYATAKADVSAAKARNMTHSLVMCSQTIKDAIVIDHIMKARHDKKKRKRGSRWPQRS